MKKAFTLIEVNLAISVLALGVLAIIGLYSFAYREGRQSREDVAAAAYADAVMGSLVTALSDTNVLWSSFRELKSFPDNQGWRSYLQNVQTGLIISSPEGVAQGAYEGVLRQLGVSGKYPSWPSSSQYGHLYPALTVMHIKDEAMVLISFRASAKLQMLLSAPLYFMSVRFQGVVDETTGGAN